jgi:hypothetical protein
MYIEMKPATSSHYQINWSGVLGLAVMVAGSTLGWIVIITGFRAIVR